MQNKKSAKIILVALSVALNFVFAQTSLPRFELITASGTNTYTATPSPALTSYVTGWKAQFKFANNNTGAATINLNGLGAKNIQNGSSALSSGDIDATKVYWLTYDGTNFQLSGGAGGGGGSITGSGTTGQFTKWSGTSSLTGFTPGTGIETFLTTPTSANLRAAITDETGTGLAYFQGGALGTPASGTLTNATGLPISTGVSGLGTGVATWLATPSWTNFNSAITGTAPFWSLASGGALTANNTISGAFNLGFTNTALGIGVAPASITGSTRLDVRASGTASTDNVIYAADNANTQRLRLQSSGALDLTSNFTQTANGQTFTHATITGNLNRGAFSPGIMRVLRLTDNSIVSNFDFTIGELFWDTSHSLSIRGPSGITDIRLTSNATSIGTGSGGFYVVSLNQNHTGTSNLNIFSGATTNQTAAGNHSINVTPTHNWSSGAFSSNLFSLRPTFNMTGTHSGGVSRAIDYNATRTSMTGLTEYALTMRTGLSGFGTSTPVSTVENAGSQGLSIVTSSANLTLDETHATVIITAGTGSYTLPSAAGVTRRIYIVVNQTGTARTISSYRDKANAAQTTIAANSALWLHSDGTNWYQIN